jgi:HAMP domain-containing protein
LPDRALRRRIEQAVTELFQEISDLIADSERDLDRIERTLTDGYAYALTLEAERWRLEKRLAEVAQELPAGDLEGKSAELTSLSRRLDGNADELSLLRGRLGELRRYADAVRV